MKALDRLRAHPRVEYVDLDEPGSVIVTLRQGWSWDPMQDNRVSSEATATAALRAVTNVEPYPGPYDD